jgi:hypothetical protein
MRVCYVVFTLASLLTAAGCVQKEQRSGAEDSGLDGDWSTVFSYNNQLLCKASQEVHGTYYVTTYAPISGAHVVVWDTTDPASPIVVAQTESNEDGSFCLGDVFFAGHSYQVDHWWSDWSVCMMPTIVEADDMEPPFPENGPELWMPDECTHPYFNWWKDFSVSYDQSDRDQEPPDGYIWSGCSDPGAYGDYQGHSSLPCMPAPG